MLLEEPLQLFDKEKIGSGYPINKRKDKEQINMRYRIVGSSPMVRGLSESMIVEGTTCKSHNNDVWDLHHDLYRNENHPDVEPKKHNFEKEHPRSAWVNRRTLQTFEGNMMLNQSGHGQPDGMSPMHHANHYSKFE